ncbi:MAG TPA: sodium:solute symporter family protein [Paracoccaceae bacterium]|nr:sodium:solute symporter family protein [Paracoccaceae bacterium]
MESISYQFSTGTILALLALFYGGTFIVSLLINRKSESVDGYMVSSGQVGFGISAASMTATWIWAASFYAAASSGYKYGLSGPLHYGIWGALMILFIYPFGIRFREVAPNASTLAEVIHARHGSSSQMILAISNLMGSLISLMVNFTAAGALVSILSPLSFTHGVLIAGCGVLAYTFWSGFRASILTDFAQVIAMMLVAIIIIPWVMFSAGGPSVLADGMSRLTESQATFFSREAILEQGAPFFVAVLAYAIGNQTIAQRLFAVRQDLIKPTFLTATIGYGSIVVGLGMLGLMALLLGVMPADGDLNNLIPQMAAGYLPPFAIALFVILVIGSLSSTADSDLAALSAIMMTDVYAKNLARGKVDPRRMLFLGRTTMVVATMLGLILASFSLDILVMLVFVGALWGSIVFPVIASFYWPRVTNAAFTTAVAGGLLLFSMVRFELVPLDGVIGHFFEIVAGIGAGVVLGLMTFGFLGRMAGLLVGFATGLFWIWYFLGFLADYTVLLGSLTAYGASTIICVVITMFSKHHFDFDVIAERVRNFQDSTPDAEAVAAGGKLGQVPGE